MIRSIFEYRSYKVYLQMRLKELAKETRGVKTKLSEAMGCQPAYTAQVLNGGANISLEQAECVNEFLKHTEDESRYFLLIVQFERAGSTKLRTRLALDIERFVTEQARLRNRLGVQTDMSERHQSVYYSSWHYGAIHALVSVPGHETATLVANKLGLSTTVVEEAFAFLVEAGVLERSGDGLVIGQARIHLPDDSPLIKQHHTNWRLQALRSLESITPESLHYSSVISISEADAQRIREALVQQLATLKPMIRDSKEEGVFSLNLDFFRIASGADAAAE